MKCLACGSFMPTERAGKYEVDVCGKCDSVWFDREEASSYIRRLIVKTEASAATPPMMEPKRPLIDATEAGVQSERLTCPRCYLELKPFNFAYDSNVFVAKCPQCQGIWATKDQLAAIAAHLKRHPADTMIGAAISERAARQASMDPENAVPQVQAWIDKVETVIDAFMDLY